MKPPRPPQPARHFAIPEINAMRELRHALARGGLAPVDTRTPEGCARVAAFYVMVDLVRLLVEFKSRIEAGESCRLVQVKRSHGSGRLVIEIAIQEQT